MYRARNRRNGWAAALSMASFWGGAGVNYAADIVVLTRTGHADRSQAATVDGREVILAGCRPASGRQLSYEPIRTAFRKLSWRCNSDHSHLLHQSIEPYWLPHGGYYPTRWRRDVAPVEEAICPCPTLLNSIEVDDAEAVESPPARPTLVAPPLPEEKPAASPSEIRPSEPYSPAVRPDRAGE